MLSLIFDLIFWLYSYFGRLDPACRNAGVKFRYCSVCEAPVAKRNFGRRHTHGGQKVPRKYSPNNGGTTTTTTSSDAADAAAAPTTTSRSKRSSEQFKQSERESRRPEKKARLKEGSGVSFKRDKDPGIPSSIGNRRSEDSPSSEETESTSGSGNDGEQQNEGGVAGLEGLASLFNPERRDAWLTLLDQRPPSRDKRAMSVWVRKVLLVSDNQKSLSSLVDVLESTTEEEGSGTESGKENSKDESMNQHDDTASDEPDTNSDEPENGDKQQRDGGDHQQDGSNSN